MNRQFEEKFLNFPSAEHILFLSRYDDDILATSQAITRTYTLHYIPKKFNSLKDVIFTLWRYMFNLNTEECELFNNIY